MQMAHLPLRFWLRRCISELSLSDESPRRHEKLTEGVNLKPVYIFGAYLPALEQPLMCSSFVVICLPYKIYHHLIAQGCNHMTFRCGHEFCYCCGTEYSEGQPSYFCAVWWIVTRSLQRKATPISYLQDGVDKLKTLAIMSK
ncbi:Uncharacterized protein Rs2_35639 [Raphanus sativus]|nr:Uncharacterized protein Rs2_35639 [Raphanus sativus]